MIPPSSSSHNHPHSHSHGDTNDHHSCNCSARPPTTVSQTLDELDFERSLHGAITTSNLPRIQALLSKSTTNVNALDASGYTPLLYATGRASSSSFDIVMLLLNNDATQSINVPTPELKQTPLHRACSKGHVELIYLLLKHGADKNLKDSDGKRPIDCLPEDLKTNSELMNLLT